MLYILLTIGGSLLYTLVALSFYHWHRDAGDVRFVDALFETDRAIMLLCWLWPFGLAFSIFVTFIAAIDLICDYIVERVVEWKRLRKARKQERI